MTTTSTILPAPVQQRFSAKLLSTPQARLIHRLGAVPYKMPANSGNILRMRRYNRLETAPVPVNPAMMNPPSQQLTAIDIDATISFYATYTVITKEVTLENQDPVLNENVARLGQSMRETEDQLIRDMLEATASIVNCVGGTNGDSPTEIVRSDVDGVVATLQNNDGEFVSEMIGGENKFGTGPVRDAYICMADSNMIGQLENVAGFINKAQYPNDQSTLSSEWGSIGNVRFFLSSRGSVTGSASLLGADVYNLLVCAQEAYCSIDLDGSSAQYIYHPPGWGDDPCELRQTGGYRFAFASRIDIVVLIKSSLIDSETYVMLEAA